MTQSCEQLTQERDELAAQVGTLRKACEHILDFAYGSHNKASLGRATTAASDALALDPPASLAELEARIRAEERERWRADICELYELACNLGETFRLIRIGEDHPLVTQTRLELGSVYDPLSVKVTEMRHAVIRETDDA